MTFWLQIAAGLKRELIVEIYAIAAGVRGSEGIGSISHNLEITTETHHMHLPISANILFTKKKTDLISFLVDNFIP